MLELWIVRRTAAVLPGVVIGCVIYFLVTLFAREMFPAEPVNMNRELQYGGIVASQSFASQELVVTIRSRFANGAPQNVRFRYDDKTEWFSQEYVFENGVVVKKPIAKEKERPLPAGTYVNIQRDPASDNPFRARGIAFIRRAEL